jgi:methylated-DNA-[protein]-cysteine S-methyltransferase
MRANREHHQAVEKYNIQFPRGLPRGQSNGGEVQLSPIGQVRSSIPGRSRKFEICVIDSPVGKLGIGLLEGKLAQISFLPPGSRLTPPKDFTARKVVFEIEKYFYNPRYRFNLELLFLGEPLQNKIWRTLQKIPVGKTITYGELAEKLGTSPRVIGNACRHNPLPIILNPGVKIYYERLMQ